MAMLNVPVVARYCITWAIMAAIALGAVLFSDKLALHAAINMHHGAGADLVLGWITHLADGLVPTAIALVLLLFGTRRSFLMIALSCGLSAIMVQVLKRWVFDDIDRPFHIGIIFLASLPAGQPPPLTLSSEIIAADWFRPDDLPDLLPFHQRAIETAVRYRQSYAPFPNTKATR